MVLNGKVWLKHIKYYFTRTPTTTVVFFTSKFMSARGFPHVKLSMYALTTCLGKKLLHFTKSSLSYLHKKFAYLLRLCFQIWTGMRKVFFFCAFKRALLASDESFLSSSVFFLAVARIFACHYAISATHYILCTKKTKRNRRTTKNSSPFSTSTRVWFIKPLKQWRMHILTAMRKRNSLAEGIFVTKTDWRISLSSVTRESFICNETNVAKRIPFYMCAFVKLKTRLAWTQRVRYNESEYESIISVSLQCGETWTGKQPRESVFWVVLIKSCVWLFFFWL